MIVRAGVFYDGSLEKPRRNVDVVVEEAAIREIRNAADGGEFDLAAACVTPGLVNAHVHLEMTGEADTMNAVRSLTPNQRVLHAVENARKTLQAGVTSVRDVGCTGSVAMDVRDAIAAGRIPGPRMRAAGNVICMTGGHGWFAGRMVDSPYEARKAVREQMFEGADCIKVIATGGVLTKGAVPGNAQLFPTNSSRRSPRPTATACASPHTRSVPRESKTRCAPASIRSNTATCSTTRRSSCFKQRDVYLVPTLSAPACILEHAADGGMPDYVREKAAHVNEALLRNIKRAFDAGVKIAGGSDAGTPFNLHEDYAYEVELMHTLVGMTPHQALHAATNVAAGLLGLHRGILAAGEPADLLLLEADAGNDPRAFRNVIAVIKDGALVGR